MSAPLSEREALKMTILAADAQKVLVSLECALKALDPALPAVSHIYAARGTLLVALVPFRRDPGPASTHQERCMLSTPAAEDLDGLRTCTKCGHVECWACGHGNGWCDVVLEDNSLCCAGGCSYTQAPAGVDTGSARHRIFSRPTACQVAFTVDLLTAAHSELLAHGRPALNEANRYVDGIALARDTLRDALGISNRNYVVLTHNPDTSEVCEENVATLAEDARRALATEFHDNVPTCRCGHTFRTHAAFFPERPGAVCSAAGCGCPHWAAEER